MLIVTALGGNALLRRGQPMTAQNQRDNVRVAAQALAPVAAEHVERIGVHLGVSGALERQQAHLRPVAMGDHELVIHGHGRKRLGSDAHIAALVLGAHLLAPPQERIAAQCRHDILFGLSYLRGEQSPLRIFIDDSPGSLATQAYTAGDPARPTSP